MLICYGTSIPILSGKTDAVPRFGIASNASASFQEEYPPQLVALQKAHWDPLFQWARSEFGVPLEVHSAIIKPFQPSETREALSKVLHEMDALTLAGMLSMSSSGRAKTDDSLKAWSVRFTIQRVSS